MKNICFAAYMFNLNMKLKQKKQQKSINTLNPVQIPIKQKCKKIVAGPLHSYAICQNKIYFWGKKHAHHLSIDKNIKNNLTNDEQMFELPLKIDNLATGPNHSFGWNNKQVYCWGSNQYYELGLQEQKDYGCHKIALFEQAMKNGYNLQQIQCGQSHTIAIFKVGQFQQQDKLFASGDSQVVEKEEDNEQEGIQMFAWGKSQSYQLTINSVNIIPYPVLAPCSFKHLTSVHSKSDYNVALCNYRVYSWGANLFSRLGNSLSKVRIPQQVILPAKIVKIGIGNHHVIAVTQEGEAYSWGKGDFGQLGIDRFEAQSKPSKVICDQRIVEAACGDYHTLIRLKDNRLKSCGGNKNGVLGHLNYDSLDKKKRCKRFQFVQNTHAFGQISMIACGDHHNLVLNTEGTAFGWGNNDHYQILPNPIKKQASLQQIPKQRKQLQIIIDEQNRKDKSQYESQQSIGLHLQRLQNWKKRYDLFRLQKARQEQALMKQYEQIISNLKKCK